MLKKPTTWMIAGVAAVVMGTSGFAAWEYHKTPDFCGTCHIMDSYVESWHDSEHMVRAHAEEDVICLDCHVPTIQQQVQELVAFVSGDFEDPLQRRQFDDEFCLQCHEHGSREEIAERTKDYTLDGEVRNPHDPHPDLDESVVEQFECFRCHSAHAKSAGIGYCFVECHHTYTFESCGGTDCH
jgi:nitrate/TMAO reductase-like tetraheme cytochrome c subunit